MNGNRVVRWISGAGIICGAAAGSFAISSALTGSDSRGASEDMVELVETLVDPPADLLAATTGAEPIIFTGAVTAAANRSTVELGTGSSATLSEKSPTGDVCVALVIPGQQPRVCFDRGTVLSGYAYSAYTGPDGVTHLMGVVPDDVTIVSVNGESVEVGENLWYFTATDTESLSFVVSSADGQSVASLR